MKHALSIHRQKDAIDTWATPNEIFNFAQNRWGNFTLDAAANYLIQKLLFLFQKLKTH